MCNSHEFKTSCDNTEKYTAKDFLKEHRHLLNHHQQTTLDWLILEQDRVDLMEFETLPPSVNKEKKLNVAKFKFRLEDMELIVRF